MRSNTVKIMLDKLYYSHSYVKFTVDVTRDNVIQRGYITDIGKDGLVIDFHHDGQSSRELVEFSCIHTLPTKPVAVERYLKPPQVSSEVEVLIRSAVDQPMMWTKAIFVTLLPDYGNKRHGIVGEQFALVRLPTKNPFSLVAVKSLWSPFVASGIRIRQKRQWQTVLPASFYRVTVPYTSCRRQDCPFPQSSLLYHMRQLDTDIGLKLVWLDLTGTLLVSADDVSVTVVCRRKPKALPNTFHQLVFHLYDKFVKHISQNQKGLARCLRLVYTQQSTDTGKVHEFEAFSTLLTLPDIMLLEVLLSLDRVAQRSLQRVCWRWYRLRSCSATEKCVILDAPPGHYISGHFHLVDMANAMLQYSAVSMRSLLLNQFFPSQSHTTMLLTREMQLPLELFVSYRSPVLDLRDELELYPAVNNMHIHCSMKTKNSERHTLEIIIAAPDDITWLTNTLGAGWTYCCTTSTMSDTLTGISLVLDQLHHRCWTHGIQSKVVNCYGLGKGEGIRLKEGLLLWPVTAAALDALTRTVENFCPTGAKSSETDQNFLPLETSSRHFGLLQPSGCKLTGFRPDVLKVLIRKPRLVGEDYFSLWGVQSWLRCS
ncbi:uncharacterized protein LOC129587167 [Paramacrobiotus metropolitanus]|uniref:uncharacterized protein LOC129587167 n=1 Tax=Paramacrobiotus metropolitanus TaxID=2943436 RepID=UPI0024464F73|nr:uncharacterized protein LOC129587167 [Paramacrobiotus metropolitanus]